MKHHTHSFFAALATALLAASQAAALVPNAWLVAEIFRIIATRSSSVTDAFAYDHFGNQTKYTNPEGKVYTMAYDALGRILSATDAIGQKLFQNKYDAVGNLVNRVDGNG